MDKVSVTLTVFFEEPFWVGVFERLDNGYLEVCKVTFGAEPKDSEIYTLVLRKYYQLKLSPAVKTVQKEIKMNPKRKQREVQKQMKVKGISTKSQQALKLQQEQIKKDRKKVSQENKAFLKQYQFDLKQQKRKEKHKGR